MVIDLKLIESKARRMIHPSDPFIQKIRRSNDWVESLGVCFEEILYALKNFASSSLNESLADDFVRRVDDEVFELSIYFQKVMLQYKRILERNYRPATPETKAKVFQEVVLKFFQDLKNYLYVAKERARQIEGQARMLNVFDSEDFLHSRRFLERLLASEVEDLRGRMDRAEFPLGDDLVEYDDD